MVIIELLIITLMTYYYLIRNYLLLFIHLFI